VANRIGDENDGWRVAMTTLRFERGTAFVSDVINSMEMVRQLADLARRTIRRSAPAWDDQTLRRDLAHIAAELEALWALTKRNVSEATRDGLPGIGGSVFKLRYTELRQRLAELAAVMLGRAVLSFDDLDGLPNHRYAVERLQSLNLTIAAGTSQIQRNIIAERILDMPRER
jgi:alkylation response protein AidB-like acyl-CoA dehydrogenase